MGMQLLESASFRLLIWSRTNQAEDQSDLEVLSTYLRKTCLAFTLTSLILFEAEGSPILRSLSALQAKTNELEAGDVGL